MKTWKWYNQFSLMRQFFFHQANGERRCCHPRRRFTTESTSIQQFVRQVKHVVINFKFIKFKFKIEVMPHPWINIAILIGIYHTPIFSLKFSKLRVRLIELDLKKLDDADCFCMTWYILYWRKRNRECSLSDPKSWWNETERWNETEVF